MQTKNILIGIFSLLTFATYAQTEESHPVETTSAVTELKMESENIDDSTNFDWKVVKETFKGNDPDQEIAMVFVFTNKETRDKSKIRVDNFQYKVTGKTSDLDELTVKLQKSFNRLAEIDEGSKG